MSDDTSLAHWAVTGFLGTAGGLICWLLNRSVSQMDNTVAAHGELLKDHTKQHAACTLELANFKTEVAKEYAKDASVQQSLGRLHDRLDGVAADIKLLIKEVSSGGNS